MNVQHAIELLDAVRDRLGAASVTASWETNHGDVQVRSAPRGVQILVDGQEVPLEGRA